MDVDCQATPEARTTVVSFLRSRTSDTLEVARPEGTTDPGAVRWRYVAKDVFVSLAQEFGPRTAEVVGVEYYVPQRVSVRASISSRGDRAMDLLWQLPLLTRGPLRTPGR